MFPFAFLGNHFSENLLPAFYSRKEFGLLFVCLLRQGVTQPRLTSQPETHQVAKDNLDKLELLTLNLSSFPQHWVYWSVPPRLVYATLGIKHRAMCILGMHSTVFCFFATGPHRSLGWPQIPDSLLHWHCTCCDCRQKLPCLTKKSSFKMATIRQLC